MFDSTYPTSVPFEKLHTLREMEPWRANTLEIGLNAILLSMKLPTWAQVPTSSVATRCIRKLGPLFTNEVLSAWNIAREEASLWLYMAALRETARTAQAWLMG